MARYRHHLPQLAGGSFITDGGLETTLIFHEGLELPYFAAFDLLNRADGYQRMRDYFEPYIALALRHQVGFILESATWRANADWGARLGYSREALAAVNRKAITMLSDIRDACETAQTRIVISGCIGPRGDGYKADQRMSPDQAQRYHAEQIATFSDTEADMVSAYTLSYADEAVGIVRAARQAGMPVAVSFTVETDGRLPSGEMLGEAIEAVDAATGRAPVYYMINCAHPSHFEQALSTGAWRERIYGLRANASRCSHAELDESQQLDDGDPVELAGYYRMLRARLGHLNVLGGCCGTDSRHIRSICEACI